MVILTDDCNFRCSYCYERESNTYKIKKTYLDVDFLIQRIDELLKSPKFNELFSGISISLWGGEPLLAIDSIMKLFNRYGNNSKVKFDISTNGSLLLKHLDKIDSYLRNGKLKLQVSYDGEEHNNEHRLFQSGKPSGAPVRKVIETLLEKNYDFSISTTLAFKNFDLAVKTYKEIAAWNVKYNRPKLTTKMMPSTGDLHRLDEYKDIILNTLKEIALLDLQFFKEHGRAVCMTLWTGKAMCSSGTTLFAIDTNLGVYPCHTFIYNGAPSITSLIEDSFFEEMMNYRESLLSYSFKDSCNGCSTLNCYRCHAEAYIKSKKSSYLDRVFDFTCKKSMCEYYKYIDDVVKPYNLILEELRNGKSLYN